MAAEKSKILIIGGTGYIGKFIVEASVRSNHPTFALVRGGTATSNPAKMKILEGFKKAGVTLVHGDLNDHESLVKAIKEVDVVISTVGQTLLDDQMKIIAAIKEAGNIKRFLPSEFGSDSDHVDCHGHAMEPAKTMYVAKSKIRRAIEAEGIPYTYVSSNFFAGYFLPGLCQSGATTLPTDKISILGDGNAQVIIVNEDDISTFTIKAVDDPRTLNKSLYLRPAGNIYSHNELISLWEKKTGKTLERIYVPEEEVLKRIKANETRSNYSESTFPMDIILSVDYPAFVKGDHTNFELDPASDVEATQLYPDVKYVTVDEYLNRFL